MRYRNWIFLVAVSAMGACSGDRVQEQTSEGEAGMTAASTQAETANPFGTPSDLEFGYPRFDLIDDSHYLPAFETGMREQIEEIEAIVRQTDTPTVANTLIPLETSGQMLERVANVFFGLVAAHTNETIDAVQAEIAPRLAAHSDQILLDDRLFTRVSALYDLRQTLDLRR
jgi:peptidyl-dipeptidase Dcp